MRRGVVFRIYPNKQQRICITKTIGCTRFVYNKLLDAYEDANKRDVPLSFTQAKRILQSLKKKEEYTFLKEVDDSILNLTIWNLHKHYQAYRNQNAKKPHYKGKHLAKSSFYISNQNNIYLENKYLHIPLFGSLKVIQTRRIGSIHGVTIRKTNTEKYSVSLHVDFTPHRFSDNRNAVGLDVGITDFYTTSNAEIIHNPRLLEKSLKRIKREQRKLSRRSFNSKNYLRQKQKIAKLYEHTKNQRHDFLHKLSIRLIRENKIICVEELHVKEMIQRKRLSRSISSVSWATFFHYLTYKSEWYGTKLIRIPSSFPSSQICSKCGYQNKETRSLKIRFWSCPNCNTLHQRDQNAAVNILLKGLQIAN